jgi:hypothetical protein
MDSLGSQFRAARHRSVHRVSYRLGRERSPEDFRAQVAVPAFQPRRRPGGSTEWMQG